eukprot:scaffold71413_cov39-Cyclotella_meneghiniana.AAC.2
MMVIYEYRSNAIIVKALKNNSDESMLAAFNEVYEYLTFKACQRQYFINENSRPASLREKEQTPRSQ